MRRKFILFALVSLFILSFSVRFFNLSSVPPSPYLDEVSNGYNSYSLLKTGRDEYGKFLPILMQAYNDGRPTLFVYLMTLFIQVFGLNVFAIRFPAVILSVLASISIFFLTRELFVPDDKKRKNFGVTIGILASLFYAISPWNIYSSRIGDEINMSVSFFVFGLTFFLYALNRKLKKLPFFFSIICFVIAFYAYHGIKFFLPFFVLGVAIILLKDLYARWKVALLGMLLGILLLIPLAVAFMQPGATARLGGVNTTDPSIIARSANRLLLDEIKNDYLGKIFDNRRFALSLDFTNNYLRNFAPSWLFLQQGNKTFPVPDFGPIYLFGLPLMILGVVMLIRDQAIRPRYKWLLVFWIFASVIPAAISSESPHLNRANTIFPALIILQSMGLYILLLGISRLKSNPLRYGGFVCTSLIIFASFLWFLHAYFTLFPYEQSKRYQYGLSDALQYAQKLEGNYEKIIVSNGNNLLMSYMYYLYTNKYDPELHQKNGGTKSAFFTDTHLIGKYDFRNPNLYEPTIDEKEKHEQIKVLYITNPSELSDEIIKNEKIRLLKKFQFLDGNDSIWILEGTVTKKKKDSLTS